MIIILYHGLEGCRVPIFQDLVWFESFCNDFMLQPQIELYSQGCNEVASPTGVGGGCDGEDRGGGAQDQESSQCVYSGEGKVIQNPVERT